MDLNSFINPESISYRFSCAGSKELSRKCLANEIPAVSEFLQLLPRPLWFFSLHYERPLLSDLSFSCLFGSRKLVHYEGVYIFRQLQCRRRGEVEIYKHFFLFPPPHPPLTSSRGRASPPLSFLSIVQSREQEICPFVLRP
jgi:hypothetical protein